jgi:putative CocE/NonD family hydrolase
MGGCFSYLKAPRKNPLPGDPGDARIRAVVPMHGSFDMLFSLYPNGLLKFFWTTALLTAGYMGNFSGLLMNVLYTAINQELTGLQKLYAVLNVLLKMTSIITKVSDRLAYIYGIVMERRKAEVEYARQYLKVRSARYWCDQEYDGVVEHPITAPILILAGWNDDLFNPNEGLMAYQYAEGPKRIIMTSHGHLGCYPGPYPVPAMGSPDGPYLMKQVDMWFDRFLKGVNNGVDTGPPVTFYKGGAPTNFAQAAAYPMPGTGQVSYYLGGMGTLRTSKPVVSSGSDFLMNIGITGSLSLFYFQDAPQLMGGQTMDIPCRVDLGKIPLTETGFTSGALKQDTTIMGVPRFEAFYKSSSDCTQLVPWLYEVTPDGKETLVSRGWFEGYNKKPGTLMSTNGPVEMQACYHRFKAGSRIRLKVGTADLISCWPHWAPDFIHLQRRAGAASRVILPVVPNMD